MGDWLLGGGLGGDGGGAGWLLVGAAVRVAVGAARVVAGGRAVVVRGACVVGAAVDGMAVRLPVAFGAGRGRLLAGVDLVDVRGGRGVAVGSPLVPLDAMLPAGCAAAGASAMAATMPPVPISAPAATPPVTCERRRSALSRPARSRLAQSRPVRSRPVLSRPALPRLRAGGCAIRSLSGRPGLPACGHVTSPP